MNNELDDDEREVEECIEQSPEPEGTSKIEKFRNILKTKTLAKIEGTAVDIMTANAIVTVYDNLSPQYQEKFMGFSVSQMATIAWKMLK